MFFACAAECAAEGRLWFSCSWVCSWKVNSEHIKHWNSEQWQWTNLCTVDCSLRQCSPEKTSIQQNLHLVPSTLPDSFRLSQFTHLASSLRDGYHQTSHHHDSSQAPVWNSRTKGINGAVRPISLVVLSQKLHGKTHRSLPPLQYGGFRCPVVFHHSTDI